MAKHDILVDKDELRALIKDVMSELLHNSNTDLDLLEPTKNKMNLLDKYFKSLSINYYYLDSSDVIKNQDNECTVFDIKENEYSNYANEEYAKQARTIKEFHDKLLAFKYCYDKDYTPDWNNNWEHKYYIFYDNECEQYVTRRTVSNEIYTVYFSRQEIAQQCVDWLNEEKTR